MLCELKSVSYGYTDRPVLNNISMKVDNGDIVSIIGPSGAGKTTLLKIIAGLIERDSGEIIYTPYPTLDNPIIVVFQDYLLFPHMNVLENISFGLKVRKILSKKAIKEKVIKYMEYFGLDEKGSSYPSELSAGQRQRVAIARAMVVEPDILLLDEPFANLDYNLKKETAEFIRKIQKHFNVTTISVTHDQREAFTMSDKIGILLDGNLKEFDTVENIYFNCKSIKAAKFLGPINHIKKEDFTKINFQGSIPESDIYVRPGDMVINREINGIATVEDICFTGTLIIYRVNHNGSTYSIYSVNNGLKVGDRVSLKIINYLLKEILC